MPRFFKAKTLNLPSTHKRLWNWFVANCNLVEREQENKQRVARLNKILAYGEGMRAERGEKDGKEKGRGIEREEKWRGKGSMRFSGYLGPVGEVARLI